MMLKIKKPVLLAVLCLIAHAPASQAQDCQPGEQGCYVVTTEGGCDDSKGDYCIEGGGPINVGNDPIWSDLIQTPDSLPPGDGGGHSIVVEKDRDKEEEEKCEDLSRQRENFKTTISAGNGGIVVVGENHLDPALPAIAHGVGDPNACFTVELSDKSRLDAQIAAIQAGTFQRPGESAQSTAAWAKAYVAVNDAVNLAGQRNQRVFYIDTNQKANTFPANSSLGMDMRDSAMASHIKEISSKQNCSVIISVVGALHMYDKDREDLVDRLLRMGLNVSSLHFNRMAECSKSK